MQKTIPIIIVTYNQVEKFTIPCIESIIANTASPYRIIVVDNASKDNTPDVLQARYGAGTIDIISSEVNLGWDGGNLLAIRHIDANYDYDYFCMLNSDTLVSKNWLSKLSAIMQKNDRAATVMPTERIIETNLLKDFYNDRLSQLESVRKLVAKSPLKMLMGRGLALPRGQKPQMGKLTSKNIAEIDRLNSRLEQKHKEKVDRFTFVNSGYCLLAKKDIEDDIVTYLLNFSELFPAKAVDYWKEISASRNIEHLVSKGTYVYHFRGGSGGY